MEQKREEMLTVKEWAKRAGLKLHDYDGFKDIYEKLSGNKSGDFYSDVSVRFRDAGELLCTRTGFEVGILGCTLEFPKISQYEKMAEIIPGFVERDINSRIFGICAQLERDEMNSDEIRNAVEILKELIELKAIARRKSIELNGEDKTADISEVDMSRFSGKEMKIISKHKGTVEELEEKLYSEIADRLEKLLENKKIKIKKIPIEQINISTRLLYETGRKKSGKSLEEEYMYLEIPGQQKEELNVPYTVIGGDGMREGVVFDIETENGRIKGTMSKPQHEETKTTEEQKEELEDDTEKSLQTIDAQVSTEQRENLFTRIKEYTKRIFRKSKDNNHEER